MRFIFNYRINRAESRSWQQHLNTIRYAASFSYAVIKSNAKIASSNDISMPVVICLRSESVGFFQRSIRLFGKFICCILDYMAFILFFQNEFLRCFSLFSFSYTVLLKTNPLEFSAHLSTK